MQLCSKNTSSKGSIIAYPSFGPEQSCPSYAIGAIIEYWYCSEAESPSRVYCRDVRQYGIASNQSLGSSNLGGKMVSCCPC